MRDGSPGWLTIVAADFAARGRVDDALVRTAKAAQVGLITVDDDGRVWWSDETYFLHGRPRWRRVRTVDDLSWGVRDPGALRRACIATLDQDDVELRYAAIGAAGETRDLVLRGLGRGVAAVHRAGAPVGAPPVPAVPTAVPAAPAADAPPAVQPPAATLVADIRDGARSEPLGAPPVAAPVAPSVEPPAATPVVPSLEPPAGAHEAAAGRSVPAGTSPPASAGAEGTEGDLERWDLAAAVLSATPDLLLLVDLENGAVVSMAGSAEDTPDLVEHLREGGDISDSLHPDDLDRLREWRDAFATLSEGEVRSVDARFAVGEAWHWRELRVSEFRRDAEGEVVEVVVVVRDVHDRVTSTHRMAESERAFREVFDASPVGLAVLDDAGRFTDVNDAFCRLVGRTRDGVLATVYEALLHPQDRAAAVITRARRLTEGTTSSSGDARIVRADGATVWVRVRSTDLAHEDGARTLLSIEDVTHAKATEDQLRHDALHDELTGLPNRRLLLDRLERALLRSRRSGSRMAVYFLDLDDLKRVNDTHPWKHRAGDVLITTTASAVRDALRDADTLGRLGGDEFVAICEDMGDDATVDDVGARLLRAAMQPMTIGTETIRPGASIGVALSADDDEDAQALLRRADAAMYRAKQAGGSRVVRAELDGRPAQPPLDLAGAIERRELVQQYQPVVSLSTGSVLGVITVVRRRGDDEPLATRLPGAEPPARAVPVVQWSIAQAVHDVRTVAPTRVEHVSVWIPTSARATLSDSTRAAVVAALRGPDGREGGETAPSIVLDVPEPEVSMLTGRQAVQQHLDDLLETGPLAIGVAHFTAGSVPLGVLQQVSAASVSLDPALLAEAAHDDATAEVVHALVAAASALGVVTIAMDVDSQQELETARSLGVHAVFGDVIGPAAPLDTYSDLLHGGRITLPAPRPLEGQEPGRHAAEPPADGAPPDGSRGGRSEATDEVDTWARQMAARFAEPVADRTPPPEAATEATAVETPAVETPVVEAEPVLEIAPDAPAVTPSVPPVVEAAPPVPPSVPPAVQPAPAAAEPVAAPQALAPQIEVRAAPAPVVPVVGTPAGAAPAAPLPEVPAWLPPPAAAPPAPRVPGDIGAALARELGIDLHLAPVDPEADTPQWRALVEELERRGENPL